jgi:prepilin-type N-terminal cleavage/methylation domain-containing protein
MLRRLNQAGDTIIEVMVVLAVLGLAIGISYATANRSLLAARGAQENSEATQLVQSQVEYLRAYARIDPSDTSHYIFTPNRVFCFDPNGNIDATFTGTAVDNPPANYPTSGACLQGTRYYLSISYDDGSSSPGGAKDTFTVKAYWEDVQGQGNDSVTLVYRIHPS